VQDYDCSDVDYALYAGPTDDEELDKGDFEVRFPSRESDSTGIHAANRFPIQQPGNVVRGLSPAKRNGNRNPGQQSWGRRHEEESIEGGRPAKKSRMPPRGSCSPTSDAGDGMDGAEEYVTQKNGTEMNGNEDNRGEAFYVKDGDTVMNDTAMNDTDDNDTEDNDTENNDTEDGDSEESDTEENATEKNAIITSLYDTIASLSNASTSSNNTNTILSNANVSLQNKYASLRNKYANSRNTIASLRAIIASLRPIASLPDDGLWDLFYDFYEPFIPEAYVRIGRCLQDHYDWAEPVPPSLLKWLREGALPRARGDRVTIWEHSDWQTYCRRALPAKRGASPESETNAY